MTARPIVRPTLGVSGTPRALVDALHEAAGTGLMVLEAPKGSGKTAVISKFAREYESETRYVQLDVWCSTPNVLAERVLAALQPDSSRIQAHTNIEDLQASITEALRQPFRRPLLLVLDNAESVANAPEAMKLIERIHLRMPPHGDLVVSGRAIASAELEKRVAASGGVWLGSRHFREARGGRGEGKVPPGNAHSGSHATIGPQGHQSESSLGVGWSGPRSLPARSPRCGQTHRDPRVQAGSMIGQAGDAGRDTDTEKCRSFLDRGLVNHAIQLALASGSAEVTSTVLEEVGTEALREASFDVLRTLASAAKVAAPGPGVLSSLALSILARIEATAGDPQEALRWVEAATSSEDRTDADRIHALIAEFSAARATADLERARVAAHALAKITGTEPTPEAADAAITAGDYYLYVASDTNRARHQYGIGLRFAEALGHHALIAHANNKVGDLAYTVGDIPTAIGHLQRAVRGWQRLGKTSRLAATLNNLGVALRARGDLKEAANAHQDAVDAARAASADVQLAYSLASAAELEIGHGKLERARPYLDEALEICSTGLVEERLRALVLADLAECSLREGALEDARRRGKRALLIAGASAGPLEQSMCTLTLARIEGAMGMTDEAINAAQTASVVFEAAGAVGEFLSATLELGALYHSSGNFRQARAALRAASRTARRGHHQGTVIRVLSAHTDFASWAKNDRSSKHLLDRSEWTALDHTDALTDDATSLVGTEVIYDPLTGRVSGSSGESHAATWSSSAAKRLFEIFLSNRDGTPLDTVREMLVPSDPVHRGNSAMHSAMHEVDAALYPGAVLVRDGALMIDPKLQVRAA